MNNNYNYITVKSMIVRKKHRNRYFFKIFNLNKYKLFTWKVSDSCLYKFPIKKLKIQKKNKKYIKPKRCLTSQNPPTKEKNKNQTGRTKLYFIHQK